MNGRLPAVAMMQLCQKLQERACNSVDCEHTGKSCDAAGCDNRVCKIHEHYCSGCESRYCEDCFEAHLEACRGPVADPQDEQIEQALGTESAPFAEVFPLVMPKPVSEGGSLGKCIPEPGIEKANQNGGTVEKIPGELRVLVADEEIGGTR